MSASKLVRSLEEIREDAATILKLKAEPKAPEGTSVDGTHHLPISDYNFKPGAIVTWHALSFPHCCGGRGTSLPTCRRYRLVRLCGQCGQLRQASDADDYCDHLAHLVPQEDTDGLLEWYDRNDDRLICARSQELEREKDKETMEYVNNPVLLLSYYTDDCKEGVCGNESETSSTSTVKPDDKELWVAPWERTKLLLYKSARVKRDAGILISRTTSSTSESSIDATFDTKEMKGFEEGSKEKWEKISKSKPNPQLTPKQERQKRLDQEWKREQLERSGEVRAAVKKSVPREQLEALVKGKGKGKGKGRESSTSDNG